ncbi:hypothetical protein FRAAL5634 [Frankia alni ACN14a]|uniref:Uncharacterized protein n=1 Tax=Frankia alni (strain DSM 45986 / CECT 9034 / ACN14a) TaxID=326424 RepID=Q0RE45_FRAAA|nr:hypothetical protein FRAAL5634 [Frankia alni ACN14a]
MYREMGAATMPDAARRQVRATSGRIAARPSDLA